MHPGQMCKNAWKHQLKIFPPSNLEVQNTLKFAVLSQTLHRRHCLEDNVWQAGSRNVVFSPEWRWRLKDQTFATFLYILFQLTNVSFEIQSGCELFVIL